MATCSSYLETEEHGYLPDSLLKKVSYKLPMSAYIPLAAYLGVNSSILQQLTCESDRTSQATEMLMVWFNQCETDAWITLVAALEVCRLNDVVAETRRFLVNYMIVDDCNYPHSDNMNEILKVHAYISLIAAKISGDWEALGAYLGLSMYQLALISHFQTVSSNGVLKRPVYEVLKIWKEYQTSPPTTLIMVLTNNMGRADIALYVEGLSTGFSTNIKVGDTTTRLLTLD